MLILPIVVIGSIGTSVAVLNRGGNPEFMYHQQNLSAVRQLCWSGSSTPRLIPGRARPGIPA
jgi:hypothetical protein